MKKLGIIVLIILVGQAYGQQYKKYIKKAEKAVAKVDYVKAVSYYDKALEINENGYEANSGKGLILGEFLDRYEQAIPYLEKALDGSKKDSLLSVYYTLGKCYQVLGDYNKALYCFNKVQNYEEIGNPMFHHYVQKNIEDCNYGLMHSAVTNPNLQVKNAGPMINTQYPEYAPVLLASNEMIFTSKRKDDEKEKINKWDGKYFESMYITKAEKGNFTIPKRYTRPDLEKNSLFSKYHESSVSVSPDGRSMFIYKNGDIYIVPVNDNTKAPEKLDKKINMSRYQNHAAISKDNNTIYFSSETRNGFGGTDIFRSVRNSKGEWSTAELLDSTINTIFNDGAPYIADDGTLYFASEGHPGYGGYDIYKSRNENGKWQKPVNLGTPINSPANDLFLTMITETDGYFSSSKKGGTGDMDIYIIGMSEPIKTESTPDPAIASEKIAEPPVIETEPVVDTKNKYLSDEELKKLGWNSTPVQFNYNDAKLGNDGLAAIDHNSKILLANKELVIEIYGHTDSRGNDAYNMQLSANRANAVKQQMTLKGVNKKRILTEGKGETELLNNCKDGVECNDEQHKQNRRVEVKVRNNNYKQ
jgi:outer membrane protein OmpA-like peptidoglycan-associated protein/tetratricopeptide (TPR) repeat protein